MPPQRPWLRRLIRWSLWSLASLIVLALAAVLTALSLLFGSRSALDGTRHLADLADPVRVERDALGIPTLHATNPLDLARAVGFVHAQDRFFQMDLLRRSAAGELAELFGPLALDLDRAARRHRLRALATQACAQLPAADRALLTAYTQGANAGLHALRARPPEYWLLRQRPHPWQIEDSLLVIYAMAFDLQDAHGHHEAALGRALQALGPAAFAFYCPTGSEWEAPLDGTTTPPPSIPAPDAFHAVDAAPPTNAPPSAAPPPKPGSNAWAVGGHRTATGAALVADDMHLGLGLPNIWYRLSLQWTEPGTTPHTWRVTGVSLPGVPIIIAGSNGHVAWGFTNATTDNSDVIDLELSPDHPDHYRTPDGWEPFVHHHETLRVADAASESFDVPWTRWGPVIHFDNGQPHQAVRWVFHAPEAVNLVPAQFATATNAAQLLDLAAHAAMPAQNVVAGDAQGHIGWTLSGLIPNRVGLTGRIPTSWADGSRRWAGWLNPSEKPRVFDPPDGLIWTANQRILGTAAYARAGDGDFDLGARAAQIRDRLRALAHPATPAEMLAIQLDNEARFLARWQELLRLTLDRATARQPSDLLHIAARCTQDWGAAAATNSVGYRLVRAFRLKTIERLLEPAEAQCRRLSGSGLVWTEHNEATAWILLKERPPHLLARRHTSYDALLDDALHAALGELHTPESPLAQRTWGQRNRVEIRHPLGRAVPQLSRWLDCPTESLPGDSHMPRVQGRTFGASERFAVSPGHETDGYLHMPGGQSGHCLSPFYRAGHRAWADGTPLPFLPGPAAHVLTLAPGR